MQLDPTHISKLLNGFHGRFASNRRLKASAVMMILFNSPPCYPKEAQTHVLLIEKARDNSRHSGQIAFPGGRIEAHDATPLEAAMRETEEEIGIPGDQLRLLGSMGFFRTLTSGYDAAVYEVPLADLYARYNPQLCLRRRTDLMNLHFHWAVPNSQRQICIWGLTARVIHCFLQMLASQATKLRP
jgi:8-oxo-dGTP pyrophosphatase MutT (NUDIX family)